MTPDTMSVKTTPFFLVFINRGIILQRNNKTYGAIEIFCVMGIESEQREIGKVHVAHFPLTATVEHHQSHTSLGNLLLLFSLEGSWDTKLFLFLSCH